MYTKEQYDEVIAIVRKEYVPAKMTAQQYSWVRELVTWDFNGTFVLARKSIVDEYVANNGTKNEHMCPKLCHLDELFDALYLSHDAVGHAKTER